MIHLDTSFLVDLLREQARGKVGPARTRLSGLADERLFMSVFTRCELEVGAIRAKQPDVEGQRVRTLCEALTVVYPDERFPALYGEALADIVATGRSIATMDLLIGCTALIDEAALLTRNRKHFDVIRGLRILSY